jgi:hypothetical protein
MHGGMETKKCTRCGKVKPLAEFSWKEQSKQRRHTYCKACFREISRLQYQRKQAYYRTKAAQRRKQQIKQLRQVLYDYLKNHPCVDCGESDPTCLEFDHVKGSKNSDISRMVSSASSLTMLYNEISKYEVRCANCHRRKTAREQGWYGDLE